MDRDDDTKKKEQNPGEITRFNNYLDALYNKINQNLKLRMLEPMTINFEQIETDSLSTSNRKEREVDFDDTENILSSRRGELRNKKEKTKKGRKTKKKSSGKHTKVNCIIKYMKLKPNKLNLVQN